MAVEDHRGAWLHALMWGERVLGPSARMTAEAEMKRRASTLAAAVEAHRASPSTRNAEAMHLALDAYTEAKGDL